MNELKAKWITSGKRNDKQNSLPAEVYRKVFKTEKEIVKAEINISAMGIYELNVNDKKVGDAYFAPGYTCYEKYLQYQTYDITENLNDGENLVEITVANGWYLGRVGNKNNRYSDHRAVIAEIIIHYEDGSKETVSTDESWQVTLDTPTRFADFYDGETIDLSFTEEKRTYQKVKLFEGFIPELKPHLGTFVKDDSRLTPTKISDNIYDFKQNHAGVINLSVNAKKGTVITIRHAEILEGKDGLFTKNLRKAKSTLTLICGKEGINEFSPRFTYMGFRYAEITADKPIEIIKFESVVLTSDCEPIGEFRCSDEKLNRLQQNVVWGQISNFVDIPTDCPQRDERMGWTGDIAVFARVAAFNRNISSFMNKWLYDLSLYQRKNGTLPVVIPANDTYQSTLPDIPIAIWGDSATMVPWAVYCAYGDKELLARQYESMKKYTESEIRMARRVGFGKHKYLWNANYFQYGDWCAPGESHLKWKWKGQHLATAFFANSVDIMRKSAKILGKADDEKYFAVLHEKIKDAFDSVYIKPDGKLKGHFQSNYVCALYFGLVPESKKSAVAKQLVKLVRENNHKIATGFAGTPYILFALADNGYIEDAYKLLLNEECPGWLYCVNAGATTMWERWDALAADGSIKAGTIPNMISFNHYAYGAVGDFLYRRTLGLEPIVAGYKKFRVKPITGNLEFASGSLKTDFGKIEIDWKKENNVFSLNVTVPEGTECSIVLPDGEEFTISNGKHHFEKEI